MNRNRPWIPLALAALVLGTGLPATAYAHTLGVEVWTDRGDDAVYQPGDEMQVKVRASDDAYLLVYEIDSQGQVSMLYPWRRGSNMVEAHTTYRLPPEKSGYELAVENATGEGYIVALASRRPFRDLPWYLRAYDPQGEGNGYEDTHPDEEGFDNQGHVVGDPMVAMERIRRRVLDQPGSSDDFATSYASYYVGHEVRYPRYLCADCHRPGQWAWWDGFDPYYSTCSVFDFRVNWNWCWGPCMWTGHVPYFYYVVRPNCPPRYYGYYNNHSRWSSWDGHGTWNNLWGASLTRYKTPPPVGYVPPGPSSKPAWNPGGNNPPGYLPPSGNSYRRGGFRDPMPIGHIRAGGGTGSATRPVWGGRVQPRVAPQGDNGRQGGEARPQQPQARPEPAYRPRGDSPRQETPRRDPGRQQAPHNPPQSRPEHQDGGREGGGHERGGHGR